VPRVPRQRVAAAGGGGGPRPTARPPVPAPPVGPAPAGAGAAPPLAADEELSFLAGQWRIYQKLDKHRYSTDDVVTAWVAWCAGRRLLPAPPARCVDIGCGIGSVLLMSAWLHPAARCVGIEAQPARAAQAARSAAYNLGGPGSGGGGRVAVLNADLRDPAIVAKAAAASAGTAAPAPATDGASGNSNSSGDGGAVASSSSSSHAPQPPPPPHLPLFDLVTGTPPYFSVTAGGLPSTEETARCLFEYRGGVEAYAAAAARLLARPYGLFVVVETALELRRSYAAAAGAGLRVLARLDVVPKAGKPPLINVLVMCAQDAPYVRPGGSGGGGASTDGTVAVRRGPVRMGRHLRPARRRRQGRPRRR
jgi:tRNA1Val (adenine37-N6)-methyltransferase